MARLSLRSSTIRPWAETPVAAYCLARLSLDSSRIRPWATRSPTYLPTYAKVATVAGHPWRDGGGAWPLRYATEIGGVARLATALRGRNRGGLQPVAQAGAVSRPGPDGSLSILATLGARRILLSVTPTTDTTDGRTRYDDPVT